MNDLNGMAAQQQSRPPYAPRTSYSPNAMSPPPYAPAGVQYSTPYPYPNSQPPAKRMRMSPDAESPQSISRTPQLLSPHSAGSPNGSFVNNLPALPPNALMGPPSRPADRLEDREQTQTFANMSVSPGEQDQKYAISPSNFYGARPMSHSFPSGRGSFGNATGVPYARPGSSGNMDGVGGPVAPGINNASQMTAEETQRQQEIQADYDAAKYSQTPLWDQFLYAEEVQKRISRVSVNEHLKAVEGGLMRPSRHHDPQPTRVNGSDGASRVIDLGQTILSLDNGKPLKEIIETICSATQVRLRGVVDLAARLARERKEHSKGQVPNEWADIAVLPPSLASSAPQADAPATPAASSALKRTHSQASADAPQDAGTHRLSGILQKVIQADRDPEEARRAKRAKRTAAPNADGAQPTTTTGSEIPIAPVEPDKKTTKKERKIEQTKFSEQEQHRSANETARLATAGLIGRLGGKQKKSYSWLNAGTGSSAPSTPSKGAGASASSSAAVTPLPSKAASAPKEKAFGQWSEDNDDIQVRDVLLVLENDGRASRSVVRGYSKPEG